MIRTASDAQTNDNNDSSENHTHSVYVPPSWCEPTHVPGEIVWHNCRQYEVTGVAPNHSWGVWSYTVLPVRHKEKPDFIANLEGYLLEHQVGKERPAYCDEQSEPGEQRQSQE